MCGAELATFAIDGFCPACLLERGLSSHARDTGPPFPRFGDYELIQEIARGGMGVVYKARQVSLGRIVAVKMILSGQFASAAEMQRFRAEARATAALQHPGIVAIHEVGEHDGLLYFSMDFIEGQNLTQLIRDGPWTATRAAQCVRDVTEAIHYAHERGVLHRDLKPSNVLVDSEGKPRVTDFGLAKRLHTPLSSEETQLTLSGQVLGSPNFMPPEQASGKHRELTPAADVYSLGALLYHLLTGRPPFLADNVPATLRLVAEAEPAAPHLLAPNLPRDLETICLKCLEKDPRRRYATARELVDELERFLLDEPIRARPVPPTEKLARWCRRYPATVGLATLVGLLVVMVVVVSTLSATRSKRAEREQTRLRQEAEAARAREAELREKAEDREKMARAKVLFLNSGEYDQAEALLNEIPVATLEASIMHAKMRRSLGWRHSLQGRWPEAATNFALLLRLHEPEQTDTDKTDPIDTQSLDYLLYGPSLIELDDKPGYESFRQLVVSRHAHTTNSVIAERVCKVSLLLPADDNLIASLGVLYDVAARRQEDAGLSLQMKNWASISLALVDYRRGNFLKSAEWCERCLASPQKNAPRTPTAQAILAMARYRLAPQADGRAYLAQAASTIEAAFQEGGAAYGNKPELWFFDWIFARILLREAIGLIGDPSVAAEAKRGMDEGER
jgi:tRNA A-37 threonylcarbamoyl transferase component Bud32/tetratricopeptide (TPR) repeat protein